MGNWFSESLNQPIYLDVSYEAHTWLWNTVLLMLSLLVFWNKWVQKVPGEWLAVCHTICHEEPFQISGNGMYGQGGKKNKMVDRFSGMHESLLAGVAAENDMELRLTIMEWAPKGGGFPRQERTGSGKLHCITAVFVDEKELHSETLKVLQLLDRRWSMKSLSTPHLKSELFLPAYVRRHTASLKGKLISNLADVAWHCKTPLLTLVTLMAWLTTN